MWLVSMVGWLVGCVTTDTSGGDDTAPGDDTGSIPGPTPDGRVEWACAPDDGGALRIITGLSGPGCDEDWSSVAHVRLNYWGHAPPLDPGSYPFDHSTGSAWYADEADAPEEFAGEGTFTIDTWTEAAITGSYEIVLDGGGVVTGAFVGPWCDTGELCG